MRRYIAPLLFALLSLLALGAAEATPPASAATPLKIAVGPTAGGVGGPMGTSFFDPAEVESGQVDPTAGTVYLSAGGENAPQKRAAADASQPAVHIITVDNAYRSKGVGQDVLITRTPGGTVPKLSAKRAKGNGIDAWELVVNGDRTSTGVDVLKWGKLAESQVGANVVPNVANGNDAMAGYIRRFFGRGDPSGSSASRSILVLLRNSLLNPGAAGEKGATPVPTMMWDGADFMEFKSLFPEVISHGLAG